VRDLAPCPTRDSSSDGHCVDRPVETAHESAVPQVTVPQTTDPQISNSELNNTRERVGEAQECRNLVLRPEGQTETSGCASCEIWCGCVMFFSL